jgi:hypothetical protein
LGLLSFDYNAIILKKTKKSSDYAQMNLRVFGKNAQTEPLAFCCYFAQKTIQIFVGFVLFACRQKVFKHIFKMELNFFLGI